MQSIYENLSTRWEEHKYRGFRSYLGWIWWKSHQKRKKLLETELHETTSVVRISGNGDHHWIRGDKSKMMVILETQFVDDFQMVILCVCHWGKTEREKDMFPKKLWRRERKWERKNSPWDPLTPIADGILWKRRIYEIAIEFQLP